MVEGDCYLTDETPPGTLGENLRLALEAHRFWVKRLSDSDLWESFLVSCSRTVPFYERWFGGREPRELGDFPVVDRSNHYATRRDFLARTFDDPRSEQLSIYTNGTVGRSLRVSWDLPALFDLNYASYLRFAAAFPPLLDFTVAGQPTVFVISDSPRDLRTSVVLPSLNATILRRLILGRGRSSDVALVRHLQGARVALLHGKPSVLLELMAIDNKLGGNPRVRPAMIVCSGENLYPDDRARLERWFGGVLLNAYVASEGGLIALECEEHAGMHVLSDHLTVEVESGTGRVRPTGEGQILISNALNWRHAFVRYRIGDRATVTYRACRCGHDGPTIIDLPGRERACYGTGAAAIDVSVIESAIAAAGTLIKQYQVAPGQGDGLVISWIPETWDGSEAVGSAISESLRAKVPGLSLEVLRVPRINAPGGKLRRFL